MDNKKNELTVVLVQTDIVWNDVEGNLTILDDKMGGITENVDLIVLPEMFTTGFNTAPNIEQYNDSDQLAIQWMQRVAQDINCDITGSIIYNDNGKLYNRLIWAKPNGHHYFYNKKHLFSCANEHKVYEPGSEKLITSIDQWNIKPLICYDLRFPEWSRNKTAYDVLVYVANWPETRINEWQSLLAGRAIENQCYVIAVNRVGTDKNGLQYSGNSMVYSPKGEILCDFAPFEQGEKIVSLSYENLYKHREQFPFLQDQEF